MQNIMMIYNSQLPCSYPFETQTHPSKSGKVVFLIRRQQADAPNHCSNYMFSFNFLYGHAVATMPSGAPLRSAVCHTACSSSPFVTAAFCVLRNTSFIRFFTTLHFTSFATHPFASRQGICHCVSPYVIARNEAITRMHLPFRKQRNAHWVSFRFVHRSFISVLLSPLAANYFARRRSPLGCA